MNPWHIDTGWLPSFARRALVVALTLSTTGVGLYLMATILAANGLQPSEAAILPLFALAFGWIALSFWIAVPGLVLVTLGRHPITLRRGGFSALAVPPLRLRVALLVPIYNEDVDRVFAGIAAMQRSLRATGHDRAFDFFLLSDTRDETIAAAEVTRWQDARRTPGTRLYYRRRMENTGRKAGNIADWVRGWGGAYDAMVVLDADSVMTGDTLVRLAAALQANPDAGLIQTQPVAVLRQTPFARALQFAGSLYGPMLAAGAAFWQAGEANYYGHNAIIRVRAFAEHAGLPALTGLAPLGGDILSHDFVEAGCLRRAGWCVWFLSDLDGSYEEVPSNALDFAARDRRWAQGNMQHLRLLAAPGLHAMTKFHFSSGAFAFLASPLWLALLLLSSAIVIDQSWTPHRYFSGYSLFPVWPEYRPEERNLLLSLTAVLLFGPKVLACLQTLSSRRRRLFGGAVALLSSMTLELLFSVLLAPITMFFHTMFVLGILSGRAVGWSAQPRDDRGVPWRSAIRRHLGAMVFVAAWLSAVWYAAPAFLPWIAPIALGPLIAIPFTVWGSRAELGLRLRRWRVWLTPAEVATPRELREVAALTGTATAMQR